MTLGQLTRFDLAHLREQADKHQTVQVTRDALHQLLDTYEDHDECSDLTDTVRELETEVAALFVCITNAKDALDGH